MQLTIISIVMLLPLVAYTYGVERRQSSLASAVVRECFDINYRFVCEESTFAQEGATLSLQCGPNWLPIAENFAAQCTRGRNGDYCFHLLTDGTPEYTDFSRGSACAPAAVVNSTSECPEDCRNFLQSAVDEGGCCFLTIYNERLSQLILGHDVDVSLEACGIDAPPPCDGPVKLTPPRNPDNCTSQEFWARTAELFCDSRLAQPYVDAVLRNFDCIPLARHHVNVCGRGVDNRFCLDLFETSVNPVDPFRTLRIHAELSDVVQQCTNSSSFQVGGCPSHCRDALQAAVDAIGCCINIFNDPINGVLHPHLADEVLAACGIENPGICESSLTTRDGSITIKAVAAWIYFCLALLYILNQVQ